MCGPKGLGYEPWARKPSVSSLRCWPKGQPTHVSKGQRPLLARGPDLLCKSGLGSIGLQGQCIEWVGAFGPNQCVGCSLQGRARRALTCEQLLMHCLGPMGLKAHWQYGFALQIHMELMIDCNFAKQNYRGPDYGPSGPIIWAKVVAFGH